VQDRLCQPIDHVVAAVASRSARAHRDREVYLAPSLVQFLGDLGTGLARADHEYATVGELAGPPVLAGVDLL
jgi:hypothetical protein